jgi:hypothetical protein
MINQTVVSPRFCLVTADVSAHAEYYRELVSFRTYVIGFEARIFADCMGSLLGAPLSYTSRVPSLVTGRPSVAETYVRNNRIYLRRSFRINFANSIAQSTFVTEWERRAGLATRFERSVIHQEVSKLLNEGHN